MASNRFIKVAPALLLFAPALANAQAVCPPDYVGCHLGDVDFTHRDALFDDVTLDTGWVPAGSPVQVRFALFVGGSTQVDMGGTTITSWPAPLDVSVVGRPGTGRLAMNYGIEIIARIRIDVTVAGTHYTWEGDIPIGDFPRDLRLAAEVGFDPFLLPPSTPRPVSVSDTTETVRLYDVGLSSVISLPGIGGGFAVDAQAALETTYQTDSIHLTDSLSEIVMENGHTIVRPALGMPEFFGFKDVEVLPHGTVGYDGMINIMPTLYVTLPGGFDWMWTPVTIPVPIVDFESNTDFNTDVVHVPLPDIDVDPTSLDFGMVESEGIVEQIETVSNEGEDTLSVSVAEPAAPFIASQTSFSVPPNSSVRLGVTFHASGTADLTEAELLLQTNDPDEPVVRIGLTAFTDAPMVAPDAGVPDGGDGFVTDGGCGCRAATPRNNGPLFVIALVALGLVLRRRTTKR